MRRSYDSLLRRGHFLGLALTLFGVCFFLLYLSNVQVFPFLFLELGVASIVIGIVISFKTLKDDSSTEICFLLAVYAMSFALSIMLFVRFGAFSGTDNLREFRAAQISAVFGWNTPSAISIAGNIENTPYLSCLSTTLLPSILSLTTGISLLSIFEFGLTAIASLRAVLVYLTVKAVFGRRDLAALSAILYSQLYFIIFSYNMRNAVTTVLLLSAFLVFFKVTKRPSNMRLNFLLLLTFFVTGVVTYYYTITYSLIIISAVFTAVVYLDSNALKKTSKIKLSSNVLKFSIFFSILVLCLSLAWFSLVPTSPFFENLTALSHFFKPSILSSPYSITTQYITASPLGPIIDGWFEFGLALAGIGFLILLIEKKKTLQMRMWFAAGGLYLATFATTFIPYLYKTFGGWERVYQLGYVFLCAFTALAILKLDKRSYGLVLVIFLLLSLPMNLLLPDSSRYVLYHPESSVEPYLAVRQSYISDTEFAAAVWIQGHLSANLAITVDQRGFYDLYILDNPLYSLTNKLGFQSQYLFLTKFTVKYGLWIPYGGEPMISDPTPLLNSSNILYNNGNEMFLEKPN